MGIYKRQFARRVHSALMSWIRRRQLELGSYVAKLKEIKGIENLEMGKDYIKKDYIGKWLKGEFSAESAWGEAMEAAKQKHIKELYGKLKGLTGTWVAPGQKRKYVIEKGEGH